MRNKRRAWRVILGSVYSPTVREPRASQLSREGGSLADSSGKCYNFITAINSGGKRGDTLSRRNETIGGHKLCARKWHIKCGVYVGADAYNANVGRQWS